MKKMILTGLGQETDFEKNGEGEFLLVFNKGELRVPISESAFKEVVRVMYKDTADRTEETPEVPSEDQNERDSNDVFDEDGVGQI